MANGDTREHSEAASDSVDARVQAACTSGHTGVVRVTVVGDIGYWYFRRGAIIHATTLDLIGEEAALCMLSWEAAQWEQCSRPWPLEQTIFISWVELYQRAAEQQRAATAREAAPPESVTQPRRAAPWPFAAVRSNKPARSEPPVLSASQVESLAADATDFVAIENNGHARSVRGDSESLTELTSYALQQCDRIAVLLGGGRCQVLEVGYRAHTLLIACSATNTLGLTVPCDADLDRVKAKLRI